jgi:hypothetical protein
MYDTKQLITFLGFIFVGIAWILVIMEIIGLMIHWGAAISLTILWISIIIAIVLVFYSFYGEEKKND